MSKNDLRIPASIGLAIRELSARAMDLAYLEEVDAPTSRAVLAAHSAHQNARNSLITAIATELAAAAALSPNDNTAEPTPGGKRNV